MDLIQFPTHAGQVAQWVKGEVVGNQEETILSLSSLENASISKESGSNESGGGALSFLAERKLSSALEKIPRGVILTLRELVRPELPLTYIVVSDPKRAFFEIAKAFLPPIPWRASSSLGSVHPLAKVASSAVIAPHAVVCEGAVIGEGTILFPYTYVGPHVQVGNHCEIHPFTVLLANVVLGNRVRIFSGSVLGSEGFGFVTDESGRHTAVPQIGKVVVEDDVRIGAKCTIDRATLGETRIGQGTILDAQVHIGHNSLVGKNGILCAQVGLAGSTILEDNVVLGGQVGLAGHMTVGKGARLAGQTGASSNLKGGQTYLSSPAMPIETAIRAFRYLRKLPELFARVKHLEEKLQ